MLTEGNCCILKAKAVEIKETMEKLTKTKRGYICRRAGISSFSCAKTPSPGAALQIYQKVLKKLCIMTNMKKEAGKQLQKF